MEILLPGKSIILRREKIRQNDFAPSEKIFFLLRPWNLQKGINGTGMKVTQARVGMGSVSWLRDEQDIS